MSALLKEDLNYRPRFDRYRGLKADLHMARDATQKLSKLAADFKRNPYKKLNHNQQLDLRGRDLRQVKDFKHLPLAGADLRGAKLPRDLSGINLAGACLAGADLTNCNLKSANLQGANLEGATLAGANLAMAQTNGAVFSKVKANGANLESGFGGVAFDHAQLNNTKLNGNFTRASMAGANLQGASGEASFSNANLQKANLQSTEFTEADFTGADATGANLESATFRDCKLSGMQLTSAAHKGMRVEHTGLNALAAADNVIDITPRLMPRRPAQKNWAGWVGPGWAPAPV